MTLGWLTVYAVTVARARFILRRRAVWRLLDAALDGNRRVTARGIAG
jgi:hypothetical protein